MGLQRTHLVLNAPEVQADVNDPQFNLLIKLMGKFTRLAAAVEEKLKPKEGWVLMWWVDFKKEIPGYGYQNCLIAKVRLVETKTMGGGSMKTSYRVSQMFTPISSPELAPEIIIGENSLVVFGYHNEVGLEETAGCISKIINMATK